MNLVESIREILLPWLERDKERKDADDKKFAEIVKLLDPSDINSWCDDLHNAYYRRDKIALLDNYTDFIGRQDSYFFRRKQQKKYKIFNTQFLRLRSFLVIHFFTNTNDTNFFHLYPELQETDPALYHQRLDELHSLLDSFRDSYGDFIRAGKERYISFLSLIIPVVLLLLLVAFMTGRSESFSAEFPSVGYNLENTLPTVAIVGFDGVVKNISSVPRYLETFNYALWENESLGKTLGYGGGVGHVFLVKGNEYATITTPILFAPNESKHLNWRYTIDISDQKELNFFLEKEGEGVFTWQKNSPALLMKDSRGNLFDEGGKLISQEVIDAWWVFPNNRSNFEKVIASLDLSFKIAKWRISRFFNWQT